MKSGLVVILFTIRILKELGIKNMPKIIFSIVPDEETGSLLGTQRLFETGILPQDSKLALALHQSIIDVTGTPAGFELCPGLLETRFFNNWKLVSR